MNASIFGLNPLAGPFSGNSDFQKDDPYPTIYLDGQAMIPRRLPPGIIDPMDLQPSQYPAPSSPPFVTVAPASMSPPPPTLSTTTSSSRIRSPTQRQRRKSTRSRSSRSISDEAPDPIETDPPPKKIKSEKKTSAEATPATSKAHARRKSSVDDDVKRNGVLERNRIAALKCRKKKKQYVEDLEEQRVGLETQHIALQAEYNSLLNEVTNIKNHLMDHATCNDPHIDRWLDLEARRFVQVTKERISQETGDPASLTFEQIINTASAGVSAPVSGSSTHRSSPSEGMAVLLGQDSVGNQPVGELPPPRAPSPHAIQDSAWMGPPKMAAYPLESAQTSPTMPPFALKHLTDEEG